MNQEQRKEQVRKRNNERYKSDAKYKAYQLNKSKIHRKAQGILVERHRKEFDNIYEKLKRADK